MSSKSGEQTRIFYVPISDGRKGEDGRMLFTPAPVETAVRLLAESDNAFLYEITDPKITKYTHVIENRKSGMCDFSESRLHAYPLYAALPRKRVKHEKAFPEIKVQRLVDELFVQPEESQDTEEQPEAPDEKTKPSKKRPSESKVKKGNFKKEGE